MARRVEAASVACVAALCGHTPPPRQKVCKVFETKDIRLDFGLTSYAKSKSPACAGLGFFSDLSIAAVSMVWPITSQSLANLKDALQPNVTRFHPVLSRGFEPRLVRGMLSVRRLALLWEEEFDGCGKTFGPGRLFVFGFGLFHEDDGG
jgi:hypothetical protein